MESMETTRSHAVASKKVPNTPKSFVHKKFGIQARYVVEEVQQTTESACPGLAIPQKGPCLFRCRLHLPDMSVMSDVCNKKRDAEQSAAAKALEKLGIHLETNDTVTIEDPWDGMVERLLFLFSDEFLPSLHPLSGHFRAALQSDGGLSGLVPVSVMAICDSKLNKSCRSIVPEVESNPSLSMPLIIKAAARLSGSIVTSEGQLWMRRKSPYPPEVLHSIVDDQSVMPESFWIEAVRIPYALEKTVESLSINVPSHVYYLDAIAKELQVMDASKVLLSRSIGKSSSEMRLYFHASVSYLTDLSSEAKEAANFEEPFNARASYFSGQDIYGNAILASIGYTWRSKELFHEDVSLHVYYRMLISKMPSGLYKLSREAVLATDLPSTFTTRTNWRGSVPKDLLCAFCRQHRLPEPSFTPVSHTFESLPQRFWCGVKFFSKCQVLIAECAPREFYKKQNDGDQNAALKVLSWLNHFFEEPDMPLEKLKCFGDSLCVQFNAEHFFKVFALCSSVHKVLKRTVSDEGVIDIEGPSSGISPSNGSLACINYTVSLVIQDDEVKDLLESKENFEFEIGTGAVIPQLESGVILLSVGECVSFLMQVDEHELMLIAAIDSTKASLLSSSKPCWLEYSVTLLKVTEPLEDRMEQAFFSPPLSKQRVEFALKQIKERSAKTLIDFGCGSGSLLSSLLEYPTALEKLVGVDISQRGLIHAAKAINSKLSGPGSVKSIQSVVLYEGSITDVDSRLCGFDMGTCLEVIEHMEEEQARVFGDVALSCFRPRVLLVSTPNYEYNVILKRPGQENLDEKASRFRNHDHKFEWTRQQFNHWAMDTAARHGYDVEFSGVGGCGETEPGFASQIAVFWMGQSNGDHRPIDEDLNHRYRAIWGWNRP